MRKLFFSFFTMLYCYVVVYYLLMNPYAGPAGDIKPMMCQSFFYYCYTTRSQYFPSNHIGLIKYREFYYYLFQPIDSLANPFYGEIRNDGMEE